MGHLEAHPLYLGSLRVFSSVFPTRLLKMAPLRPLCLASVASLLVLASAPQAQELSSQHVRRVVAGTRFSPDATLFGFRWIPEGTQLTSPMGVYGLRLRCAPGIAPEVWMDHEPRSTVLPGLAALSNHGPLERAKKLRTRNLGRAQEPDPCVLAMTVEAPINRIGFELRSLQEEELNVVLRCFDNGEEIGHVFCNSGLGFQFMGVESSRPFDELHVEFVNPTGGPFSLDNLIHELDLRDYDHDGWADFTDNCVDVSDPEQGDADGDGIGDACDLFPEDAENDIDGDGIGADLDNCPSVYNPDQRDLDGDGIGDDCDDFPFGSDRDGDGVGDLNDNCPDTFNPEQVDCDLDGIGDACDGTLIDPASVSLSLERGECVTLQKTVCLPPSPPVVDIVILFDTTASMGGEIALMRQNVLGFINGVRGALPTSDVRFGLATFRDYPGAFEACGYQANYSRASDKVFEVVAPIGSSNQEVQAAVNGLEAGGGEDPYEAYARALWEMAQPDSGIGFRHGAARFVLLVGDAGPHDCNVGMFLQDCAPRTSTGRDPGRDGILRTDDDIDFQEDALAALLATNTHVMMFYTGSARFCAWQSWCGLTGGAALKGDENGRLPPSTNLVSTLVNLIRTPLVNKVTYHAAGSCGLDIRLDPTEIPGPIDVLSGAQLSVQETICVPADLPLGAQNLDCLVQFFADDVLVGTQTVHVSVGCGDQVLDFETEDDGITPLLNGQALSTPPVFGNVVALSSSGPNAGLAVFDSTPGGPNDPSINSDMLVGHGNMLLLQDNARAHQSTPGIFDAVTDDPQGGNMIFDFLVPVTPRSVLLADINPPPNQGASVTLTDEAGRTRVYAVQPGWTGPYGDAGPRRLALDTTSSQVGYGTRVATATQTAGFRADQVVRIVVHMTGYGAIDELTFCR